MRNLTTTLALLAASLLGCSGTPLHKPTPTWIDGDYAGTLSAPPSPGCGFPSAMLERFTWTITTKADTIQIILHSPYENTLTYTSCLRKEGTWWDLSGSYTATNALGSGTFVGRLFASDRAIIFVHTVSSTTNPSCTGQATLAGTRSYVDDPAHE